MDLHKFARRDLQALCKKNQIQANGTNIAMANALASLQNVKGLDEFLNPPEHDVTQSPETEKTLTQVITRSMTRASTGRRTAHKPETEQLPSCTSIIMRNRNVSTATAASDKERKVLNFTETPAFSRTKKRSESASVQLKEVKEKLEGEKNEEGDVLADGTVNTMAKTRQGKTRASVTQWTKVYTRRSTRLLEKKMNDLMLSDEVTRDLEPIKMSDLAAGKDLTEDLEDAIKDEYPSESVKEDLEAEIVACEVETLVEVESIEAEGIANIQDEKIDEVDESLVEQLQEELTSVEEAADEYGYVELTLHVAPANGDDISELTAQVTSLDLNFLKGDCNKDMDSGEVENTAVPDDNDVVLDGYLADPDAISECTLKVESLNGDGELEIHGDALTEQPNNPIAYSAAKKELSNNIGQLFDADVTEAELAMELLERFQKSVETVDVQIANGACETVKDSNLISAGDSEVELPEEDIFSTKTPASIKKASKVRLSPLSVGRLTKLATPLKSSSKKMQLKDENKENVGEGVEFGKKIITELPVTDEDSQEPTPLKKKSLGQLKKLLKKKIQMQNEKRPALQMVPENNRMAVAGEKDD